MAVQVTELIPFNKITVVSSEYRFTITAKKEVISEPFLQATKGMVQTFARDSSGGWTLRCDTPTEEVAVKAMNDVKLLVHSTQKGLHPLSRPDAVP